MSTEYFIFVDSNDISELLRVMCKVSGVKVLEPQLFIDGLLFTDCKSLDQETRRIMREDYGKYGLDVNWRIGGTNDKLHKIDELMLRLFKCVAVIAEEWPERSISLMRNAESFYVINTVHEVLLSSVYTRDNPTLVSLFKKHSAHKDVRVCRFM